MGKHAKYQPLTSHLRAQRADQVRMTFTEIERVIGAKLPHSAEFSPRVVEQQSDEQRDDAGLARCGLRKRACRLARTQACVSTRARRAAAHRAGASRDGQAGLVRLAPRDGRGDRRPDGAG